MNGNVISAVFDTRAEAERAVMELRAAGVSDSAISIIGRHDGHTSVSSGDGHDTGEGAGEGTASFLSKTAAGAGVGTLLGIAALAIPGVGPLAAAGAIAASAIPGAAVTGAAVGAAAGGLGSLLTDHGVSREDADYYEGRINDGGVFVSVDPRAAGISPDAASDILYRAGGHSSSRSRMATSSY